MADVKATGSRRTPAKPKPQQRTSSRKVTTAQVKQHDELVRAGYQSTPSGGYRSTGAQSAATSKNLAAVRAAEAQAAGDRARAKQAAARKAAAIANKKANAAKAVKADQGGRPRATPKRKRAI